MEGGATTDTDIRVQINVGLPNLDSSRVPCPATNEAMWKRLETLVLSSLNPITQRLSRIEDRLNGFESQAKSNFHALEGLLVRTKPTSMPLPNGKPQPTYETSKSAPPAKLSKPSMKETVPQRKALPIVPTVTRSVTAMDEDNSKIANISSEFAQINESIGRQST